MNQQKLLPYESVIGAIGTVVERKPVHLFKRAVLKRQGLCRRTVSGERRQIRKGRNQYQDRRKRPSHCPQTIPFFMLLHLKRTVVQQEVQQIDDLDPILVLNKTAIHGQHNLFVMIRNALQRQQFAFADIR